MNKVGSAPEHVTVEEAAALKGIGKRAIYKAITDGRLLSVRVFGRIVIPKEALASYEPKRGGSRGGGRPRKSSS